MSNGSDYDWVGFYTGQNLGTDPAAWSGDYFVMGPGDVTLLPASGVAAYNEDNVGSADFSHLIRSIGQMNFVGSALSDTDDIRLDCFWHLRFIRDVRVYLEAVDIPAEDELGSEGIMAFGQETDIARNTSGLIEPLSLFDITGGAEWDIASTRIMDDLSALVFSFNIRASGQGSISNGLAFEIRGRNLFRDS